MNHEMNRENQAPAGALLEFHRMRVGTPQFAHELLGSKSIPDLETLDAAYRTLLAQGDLTPTNEVLTLVDRASDHAFGHRSKYILRKEEVA